MRISERRIAAALSRLSGFSRREGLPQSQPRKACGGEKRLERSGVLSFDAMRHALCVCCELSIAETEVMAYISSEVT
jgi:hypothetical protein